MNDNDLLARMSAFARGENPSIAGQAIPDNTTNMLRTITDVSEQMSRELKRRRVNTSDPMAMVGAMFGQRPANDVYQKLPLTVIQAYDGGSFDISYEVLKEGYLHKKMITVLVPPKCENQYNIVVQGGGNDYGDFTPQGDLVVEVTYIIANSLFMVEGKDLILCTKIGPADIYKGFRFHFNHPNGQNVEFTASPFVMENMEMVMTSPEEDLGYSPGGVAKLRLIFELPETLEELQAQLGIENVRTLAPAHFDAKIAGLAPAPQNFLGQFRA
jgi:hypothetical protein